MNMLTLIMFLGRNTTWLTSVWGCISPFIPNTLQNNHTKVRVNSHLRPKIKLIYVNVSKGESLEGNDTVRNPSD